MRTALGILCLVLVGVYVAAAIWEGLEWETKWFIEDLGKPLLCIVVIAVGLYLLMS